MEAMEKIAKEIAGVEKWKCPFSHEKVSQDYRNKFVGVGTTLGKRMKAGKSTSNNPGHGGGLSVDARANPTEDPDHALYRKENPRPIRLANPSGTKTVSYPVTCAAHHLIPAQASLKVSPLVQWLIKKGKPDVFRGCTKNGIVEHSVGYDVNGTQNGIWLPGPYAMKGKWKFYPAFPDEENENPGGGDEDFENDDVEEHPSTQFDYAVQSMRLSETQFHDAHPDYSRCVELALLAVNDKMDKSAQPGMCDKCGGKLNEEPYPTPYRLIDKLSAISKRLQGRLSAGPRAWKAPLFTSEKSSYYKAHPQYAQKAKK